MKSCAVTASTALRRLGEGVHAGRAAPTANTSTSPTGAAGTSPTEKWPWRANPSFSSTASPTVTVASSSPDTRAGPGR